MLHDRLVCGINNHQIQKRLLAEPDLKYQKAVKLALAMESASKNVGDLHMTKTTANLARSTEYVDKVTRRKHAKKKKGNTARKCRSCNKGQDKKSLRKDETKDQKSSNYFLKDRGGLIQCTV